MLCRLPIVSDLKYLLDASSSLNQSLYKIRLASLLGLGFYPCINQFLTRTLLVLCAVILVTPLDETRPIFLDEVLPIYYIDEELFPRYNIILIRKSCRRQYLMMICLLCFVGCTKSAYSLCMDNNMTVHPALQLNQSLLNQTHAGLLPMSFLDQSTRPMIIPVGRIIVYNIHQSLKRSCMLSALLSWQ